MIKRCLAVGFAALAVSHGAMMVFGYIVVPCMVRADRIREQNRCS